MYETLEVLGPEHEYAIVDRDFKPLPIVDKILKMFHGRIVNVIPINGSSIGKELQTHVIEIKGTRPFRSPKVSEETIYEGIIRLSELVRRHFGGILLGTGMHPLMYPEEAGIWKHRDQRIYDAMGRIFNLKQHGWLNIQSFQLNLSFKTEGDGVKLHNAITNLLPYLPAITASSPIYESKVGKYLDNRLYFYRQNQREIPSLAGDIVPEYVKSFKEYRRTVIGKFSSDLQKAGAPTLLLEKEWMNSRGAILRFDRKAIEIRIMDEQECVKADVALSCFIRSLLRAWMSYGYVSQPHDILVGDLWSTIKNGLLAKVNYPSAHTAKDVCLKFLETARTAASEEENKYLEIIEERISRGNLAELILKDIASLAKTRNFHDSVIEVYLKLARCLETNTLYY